MEVGSRKILFFSISVTLLIMAIIHYSFQTGRDIAVRYSPLVDAAMEIQLEATTAHLWFEEAISGDRTVGIDEIWTHLDQSEWYAHAMLDGGKNEEGTFLALNDPNLRLQIEETISGLHSFRQIAQQRWDAQSISGIGSELDQQFDQAFLEFTLAADDVETALQKVIIKHLQTFKLMEQLLMTLILILGSVLGGLLLRYNTRINKNILALHKQEESLRITLNSIGDAVIVTDTHGAVTYLNPIAIHLTGWTSDQAIGEPLTEVFNIVHAHTREPANNPVRKVLETGLIVGLANHTMLIAKDGSEYQIADSGAPIRNPAGDISGVVLVFRDVTEDYALHTELVSSQTLIKTLLNTLPDLIWLKDPKGAFLACNSKFERMYGAQENDIVGKTDYDFLDEELADFFRNNDEKTLIAGEATVNEESLIFADDGHCELVETIKTPMTDNNGNLIGILGVARDVTNYKESLAQLKESESRLKQAQVHAKIGFWELCAGQETATWSEQMYALFGLTQASKAGPETLCDIMHKGDFATFEASVKACFSSGHEHHVEYRITRPSDGEERWIECRGKMEADCDGQNQKMSGFIQDITERKNAAGRLQLSSRVFSDTHEGIIITDPQQFIVDVNPAFSQITGYSREEVIGKTPSILQSERHSPEFYADIWKALLQEGYWYGEVWNRRKNGEVYAEMKTITAVRDEYGITTHYIALGNDITPIKKHQEQLEHIVQYDILTNLPNRSLLADRLAQAMLQCHRHEQSLAVVFLDLDNFKQINDTHGHDVGDDLLIALSGRMKAALREGDTLARFGGDEFVAILMDLVKVEDCDPVLVRLLLAASESITVGDVVLNVSASIGVTLYPQDNVDADLLIRHADQAMYAAKELGKNRYHLFDTAQDDAIQVKIESLKAIRSALDKQQFVLHYQPKVNMRTGTVTGVEALIRWQHPTRGLLNPIEFLPVIENNPMIIEMGEWVIDTVLTQISQWQETGLNLPLSTSVNIAAVQLQQSDFTDRLTTLLAAHPDVEPRYLDLEVLETSALDDVQHVSEIMHACMALGVQFSLDDFGTGYSSLTYLRRLPAKFIKIDQSFVRDMLSDTDDLAIVEGVIALTKSFKRDVIAEGVETIEHGAALLQLGCELAQGYGIARPMPAGDIPAWVDGWKPDVSWRSLPEVT